MNELDARIRAVLSSATTLPENPESPKLTDEILATFQGRHSWLLKWGAVKMGAAMILIFLCSYQFFQAETTMAMVGYAAAVTICSVAYASIFLFIWVQMNHNTTVREIKQLELKIALLSNQLGSNANAGD